MTTAGYAAYGWQRMSKHPATYTDAFLPIFADILKDSPRVLDPFGGTGKLKQVRPDAICMDIEPEWGKLSGLTANALCLPFADETFDAICTSPAYGNRMADTYTDGTHRITYTNYLGRKLNSDNSGAMQWGNKYRAFHRAAWEEVTRVLKLGGLFVLNCKNHIRDGEEQDVTGWHEWELIGIGYDVLQTIEVPTSGNGFGQNHDKRVPYESIIVFQKVEQERKHV